MTEETKKPRRKRRTKAQIEAEKAAELAAKEAEEERCIPCEESAAAALEAAEAALEKEVEMTFGSSYEKEVDAISEEVAKEEPVVSAEPADTEYIPLTGLAKLRNKYAQRQKVDKSARR